MHSFDPERHPHRRHNPLTGDSVLVSPHRTERPWLGQVESAPPPARLAYDPGCSLCPGNRRARGEINPPYSRTFAFDNDFPALLGDTPFSGTQSCDPLLAALSAEGVTGVCRVLCFSPRHDQTLAELEPPALIDVVDLWAAETLALGARHRWVQVFENKGAAMGCSNPHPHGQIWASSFLPNEARKEDEHQRAYFEHRGSPLLVDYASREIEVGTRVVEANDDWVAVVPFWAIWPYETLLLPRRRVARLPELAPAERANLAALLRRVLGGYDGLFEVSAPYSMGWHGAPNGPDSVEHWQLHAHVYPPLLRSATIRKHMVGYEMLAEPQRDLTPERAATRLRAAVAHEKPLGAWTPTSPP